MESRDVIVVGSGPAALRAAIACADSGNIPLLIDEFGVSSASGSTPIAGIAASIDEVDASSHIQDTISAAGEACSEDAINRICKEAVNTLAELERWGLVLRRREGGLPHASPMPGHTTDRVTGCGDSTVREVTKLLEEQIIKRGIQRNADNLPISLVSDNYQVRGLIVLNIVTGEILPIQAKAVILATEGYQGLWSSSSEGPGTGNHLAISVGIPPRGMEWAPKHPLSTGDYGIHIPLDVLGDGGRIRRENGEDIGPEEVLEGEPCVLDLRTMDAETSIWFRQTSSRIKDRIGIDITRDVVPLSPRVAYTTGGTPCDEFGRAIFSGFTKEGLPSQLWFTGLYAAGRSSHSGMHGERPLAGNLLLEDLVSGKAAGEHASAWVLEEQFGGSQIIENSVTEATNRIIALKEDGGMPVGQYASKLSSAISSLSNSKEAALTEIRQIKENRITLTDHSSVMNSEMLEALRLEGLAVVAEAMIASR